MFRRRPNVEVRSAYIFGKSDHGLCSPLRKSLSTVNITKTRLYNFTPLQPHFYIVKLGFTGVYIIFLISAQKHRLWVLVRTASLTSNHNLCFEQKYEKYQIVLSENFPFFGCKIFKLFE